jgi:hypothetical protein
MHSKNRLMYRNSGSKQATNQTEPEEQGGPAGSKILTQPQARQGAGYADSANQTRQVDV